MSRKIYYITGNEYKFQIAAEAFKGSGFKLLRKSLETPEIQSNNLEEIASYSAKWATNKLKQPVIVSDVGCFIETLKGFPGPFIKYANEYLSAQDFLNLMNNKKNRKAEWRDCMAYCMPGKKPVLFTSSAKGKIAMKRGERGQTSINEIFIPYGFDRPESEISRDKMIAFWNKHLKSLDKLVDYLKK